MQYISFDNTVYAVDHAVKGTDYIHGYNAEGKLIIAFNGITDFSAFEYDGTYLSPDSCLAEDRNNVKCINGALVYPDGSKVQVSNKPDIYYGTSLAKAPTNVPNGTLFILIST